MRYPINLKLIAFTVQGRDAQRPEVFMDELIVMVQGDQTLKEVKARILKDLHAQGWSHVTMKVEPEIAVMQDPVRLYWKNSDIKYTLAEGV